MGRTRTLKPYGNLDAESKIPSIESGKCPTWRFMGSYKSGYKSPNMSYNYSTIIVTPTYDPTYRNPKPEMPYRAAKVHSVSRDEGLVRLSARKLSGVVG